ncbi:MAG TPA: hypothetical protein EYP04_07235 [Anaerolineae bacterium]|nr:hypothetical protein [Anaerolineae bacterium]HIQ04876.1 hypothetical protein [Anaerolineae bacterium]
MRYLTAVMSLAFAITLAWITGQRLSTDALAVAIGVFLGVAATVPTAAAVLLHTTRSNRRTFPANGEGTRPPVLFVVPPQTASDVLPAGWRSEYNLLLPPQDGASRPASRRRFHIIGSAEPNDGGVESESGMAGLR